eukprot:gene3232-5942_t
MASHSMKHSFRKDYLQWEDYFMAVAFLASKRSKDPDYQVGACIVNRENKIVGIGYNGMPRGCQDDSMPWHKTGQTPLETKFPYVCQAAMNSILNRNSSNIRDCRIYMMQFPDSESTKLIIQSGIREIIYFEEQLPVSDSHKASLRMLHLAGVRYRKHVPKQKNIEIDFAAVEHNITDKEK